MDAINSALWKKSFDAAIDQMVKQGQIDKPPVALLRDGIIIGMIMQESAPAFSVNIVEAYIAGDSILGLRRLADELSMATSEVVHRLRRRLDEEVA